MFSRNFTKCRLDFYADVTLEYVPSAKIIIIISDWIVNHHGPLTRYAKLPSAHALGMPGTFPRHRLQRKPLVSDPGMHHVTYVTHLPWCMSGSLARGGGENDPGIPGACTTRNFTYLVRGPWWCIQLVSFMPCDYQIRQTKRPIHLILSKFV